MGIWSEIIVIAILLYMAVKLHQLTQHVVWKLENSLWHMHNDRTAQIKSMGKWDFNTKAGIKR